MKERNTAERIRKEEKNKSRMKENVKGLMEERKKRERKQENKQKRMVDERTGKGGKDEEE